MPHFKLVYFNARARAELIRLIFEATDTEYEDIRISNWAEEKKTLNPPFGQLPFFEVDGVRLCQSMTIARFAAKITGIAGDTPLDEARADMIVESSRELMNDTVTIIHESDPKKKVERIKTFETERLPVKLGYLEKMLISNGGEWFVGKKLNWSDLAVIDTYKFVESANCKIPWETIPKLQAHRKKIESIPNIAKYMASRPDTTR